MLHSMGLQRVRHNFVTKNNNKYLSKRMRVHVDIKICTQYPQQLYFNSPKLETAQIYINR